MAGASTFIGHSNRRIELLKDDPFIGVFELRDLLMLLGALFLFLLARMLEQARALETELEEIV